MKEIIEEILLGSNNYGKSRSNSAIINKNLIKRNSSLIGLKFSEDDYMK